MNINKRILVAMCNDTGDIGTDSCSEPFVTPIDGDIEDSVSILREAVKEDYDIDDYTFVEYVAVQQYVSEPKWIPVR